MKGSCGSSRGIVYAVILSFAVLPILAGCATMGEQYVSDPFPACSRIYFDYSMMDLYEDHKVYWSDVDDMWCYFTYCELTKKGYTFTQNRNEADMELKLRYGETSHKKIAGIDVVYYGFRIQLVDIRSEDVVLNKWEEKMIYVDSRYIGDREMEKFLEDFTQRMLSTVPQL